MLIIFYKLLILCEIFVKCYCFLTNCVELSITLFFKFITKN